MWNSSSAEEKQPYERKAAKLKEKYDKVHSHCVALFYCWMSWVSFLTHFSCFLQDIVAYRTKGKVDSGSAAAADDDDEEDEEGEEEEEEEDEDEDDE